MPPRNPELHQACSKFAEQAVRLVADYIDKGEQLRYSVKESHKIESSSGFSLDKEVVPIYFIAISRHDEELKKLPEYAECIRLMQGDQVIGSQLNQSVGTWRMTRRLEAWGLLEGPLTALLESYLKTKRFDQSLFDALYDDIETFLYSEEIPFTTSAPLHNFSSDVDIDFGGGLVVRKMEKEERERLLDSAAGFRMSEGDILSHVHHVAELGYNSKKLINPPDLLKHFPSPAPEELLKSLITSLRLFRSGVVGYNIFLTSSEQQAARTGSTTFYKLIREIKGDTYVLSNADVPALLGHWNATKDIRNFPNKSFQVALRRFNSAYVRESDEDRIIDYMIAMEALYFKEGETSEQAYKFSNRCAKMLSSSFAERKTIADEMRKYYTARSKVVHGEHFTKYGDIKKLEEYLRKSILLFYDRLRKGESQNDIIESLDLG